ncbi:MAG: glycosyltransferase [Cyclobacteriaceae bacterium]
MDLSIVIPVYNEAQKIPRDIEDALSYFREQSLDGEIIISDDGCKDDTRSVVQGLQKEHKNLILQENPHRGKGSAIRAGMVKAKGDIILFIDSGSCIPYQYVHEGINLIREGEADIAHASRFLPDSKIDKPKSLFRQILSRAFRIVIPLYMGIYGRYSDTQCGLKIYKKEAAHNIYRACFTDGFMIDIESIIRAEKNNLRIREFPIHWFADPDSRLTASKTFINMMRELSRIKEI